MAEVVPFKNPKKALNRPSSFDPAQHLIAGGLTTFFQEYSDAYDGYPPGAILDHYDAASNTLRKVVNVLGTRNSFNFNEDPSVIDGLKWKFVNSVKIDTVPTEGSNNLVTSGGIASSISNLSTSIKNRLDGGIKIATLVINKTEYDLFIPGGNMQNAVITLSQSVYDYGSDVITKSYDARPSVTSVNIEGTPLDPSQYEVTYEGCTGTFTSFGQNELTGYVKVTGKGTYTGSKLVPVSIKYNYIQGLITGRWDTDIAYCGNYETNVRGTGMDGWTFVFYGVYPGTLTKDRVNGVWKLSVPEGPPSTVRSYNFSETELTLDGITFTWKASR